LQFIRTERPVPAD